MKSEKLRNIISNILIIVLVVYISISVIFYALINISKNYISKDKMQNIINNIDITSIIKDNVEMENIKNELIDTGLSYESVTNFLDSEEVTTFETEVVTNVVYDILNKGDIEYKINTDQINTLIHNNIDELRNSSYNNLIAEKIELKLPNLIDNINIMLDKVSLKLQNSDTFIKYKGYINNLFKVFDLIYSKVVNIIITFVIISFILLLMLINKKFFRAFKWIGLSFILPSIVLTSFSFLLKKLFIETKFNKIIELMTNDFNKYSQLYLIVGICLIIINLVIYIIMSKKEQQTLK